MNLTTIFLISRLLIPLERNIQHKIRMNYVLLNCGYRTNYTRTLQAILVFVCLGFAKGKFIYPCHWEVLIWSWQRTVYAMYLCRPILRHLAYSSLCYAWSVQILKGDRVDNDQNIYVFASAFFSYFQCIPFNISTRLFYFFCFNNFLFLNHCNIFTHVLWIASQQYTFNPSFGHIPSFVLHTFSV